MLLEGEISKRKGHAEPIFNTHFESMYNQIYLCHYIWDPDMGRVH